MKKRKLEYQKNEETIMLRRPQARCYNAGRIGGLSVIESNNNFARADLHIEHLGMEPVNPLHDGLQYSAPWLMHMLVDLCLLARCPFVYFQPNWKQSRGARIERRAARLLRKTIIDHPTPTTDGTE